MHALFPAETPPAPAAAWSVRMADSMIARHTPESAQWHYEHGLLWMAIAAVGSATGEERYLRAANAYIDSFIAPDGGIRTYRTDEYNLDQINPGRLLFPRLRETGDQRYEQAIRTLREQLRHHPRTQGGGFWHKQIYPYQMWLDGIYMAEPFYAACARHFDEPSAFDDIAHQILLIERQTRDPETGLLAHAWDESRAMAWADPSTGRSPHAWGRAMGWYAMALVDVLDDFPADHVQRQAILAVLGRLAEAVTRAQQPESGLWYQVLDQGAREGNYLEASASAMFVYALAKGARQGYLPPSALDAARRGHAGMLRELIAVDEGGLVTLNRVCAVAGLGGDPYRPGTFEYYIGEKVRPNDFKGVGPFILASLELEQAARHG